MDVYLVINARSWETPPDGPMRIVSYALFAAMATLSAAWFLVGFVRWLSG